MTEVERTKVKVFSGKEGPRRDFEVIETRNGGSTTVQETKAVTLQEKKVIEETIRKEYEGKFNAAINEAMKQVEAEVAKLKQTIAERDIEITKIKSSTKSGFDTSIVEENIRKDYENKFNIAVTEALRTKDSEIAKLKQTLIEKETDVVRYKTQATGTLDAKIIENNIRKEYEAKFNYHITEALKAKDDEIERLTQITKEMEVVAGTPKAGDGARIQQLEKELRQTRLELDTLRSKTEADIQRALEKQIILIVEQAQAEKNQLLAKIADLEAAGKTKKIVVESGDQLIGEEVREYKEVETINPGITRRGEVFKNSTAPRVIETVEKPARVEVASETWYRPEATEVISEYPTNYGTTEVISEPRYVSNRYERPAEVISEPFYSTKTYDRPAEIITEDTYGRTYDRPAEFITEGAYTRNYDQAPVKVIREPTYTRSYEPRVIEKDRPLYASQVAIPVSNNYATEYVGEQVDFEAYRARLRQSPPKQYEVTRSYEPSYRTETVARSYDFGSRAYDTVSRPYEATRGYETISRPYETISRPYETSTLEIRDSTRRPVLSRSTITDNRLSANPARYETVVTGGRLNTSGMESMRDRPLPAGLGLVSSGTISSYDTGVTSYASPSRNLRKPGAGTDEYY